MANILLSYAEAAELVTRYIAALADHTGASQASPSQFPFKQPAFERVSLSAALGRVLAEAILADRDQPPFPRSTRDGFACRAAEANTHQLLHLAGQVRAGECASVGLNPGEVWEIMTGAPVPEGADAVFMIEHAKLSPDFVALAEPRLIELGENIVPRAAEAGAGDLLIPLGTRILPAQIAMAAQCGYDELKVFARPRVAILSTGDELVPIDAKPGPSQIRNSNSPMLAALVTSAGAIPILLPVAADNDPAVERSISTALSASVAADLLLFTGGISAGRFDLVHGALERANARFFFAGITIQPGKPLVFGELPRPQQSEPLPFFALPGNPISSAATFHLFAAPLLAALAKNPGPIPQFAQARMFGEWHGKPGLTRFLPAWCDFSLNPQVRLVSWQGSGDIAAFARSNCFLVVPSEAGQITEGSQVSILLT